MVYPLPAIEGQEAQQGQYTKFSSWPGIESIIREELAKTTTTVTVRVVEWSPDPNPMTLSPTAQTLETKVPAVDGPIKVPTMGG